MTLCAGWMLVGLYLDGWAHRHIPDLDTFFTSWHGVLYSGFFAIAGLLGIILVRNHARGDPWLRALPAAYRLPGVGVLIFTIGGMGDLVWHTLFGIEADIAALLSPTHLVLAIGGALMGIGPLRAAWQHVSNEPPPRLMTLLPALCSFAFGLSIFTFFTQFAHPISDPWAASPAPDHPFLPQALGITGILFQAALLTGCLLVVVRRWSLPFGSLTVVLTLNSTLMSMLDPYYDFILVGLCAGLGADFLHRWLRPSLRQPLRFRLFACAVPVLFYTLYFLVLSLTDGVWWSMPLWTGSILLAGVVGWLLSYLVLPPRHDSG